MTKIQPKQGSFAEALLDAMATANVSIAELAARTQLTYEHVRKLTKGIAYPSRPKLEAISKVLGLDEEEMQRLADSDRVREKYSFVPAPQTATPDDLLALAPQWRALTSEQRGTVTELIRILARRGKKKKKS